ncbi:MAG: CinA family protein [Candidatus Dormibacteria bacterium]
MTHAGTHQCLLDVAIDEAEPLARRLRERGHTVAVAESCTGGALAALLTSVPDASEFFRGGIVAYQTAAKEALLGVHRSTIDADGTVSADAAKEMARGARDVLGADVGIGITGVVGKATEGKPPGLVYAAVADGAAEHVAELKSDGSPEQIRADAVRAALRLAEGTQ